MPELPEVETISRILKQSLQHKRFTHVAVYWARTIANMAPADFECSINGTILNNIWRRGKFLIFNLSNEKDLVIHLRMSGRFIVHPLGANMEDQKHIRVRMVLDDEIILSFIDQRKFGRFYLIDDAESITDHLGPEPLDDKFTIRWFKNALSQHTGQIKTLLLNQKFIAGLGNIYVNEALWHAQIHPMRKANSLGNNEICALHQAIIDVLTGAIIHGGTSLDDRQYAYPDGNLGTHQQHLSVYDRAGDYCERCGYEVKRVIQSQRSTFYCPVCQPQAN